MTTYVQHAKPASPKRVGVLALFGCPIPPDSPVPRKLAELGGIEGQTFVFECVSTLDRLAALERLATDPRMGQRRRTQRARVHAQAPSARSREQAERMDKLAVEDPAFDAAWE
jgi:hypothetical protein